MPKKFDPEVKARAVRMVTDQLEDHGGSVTKTAQVVGAKLGIGRETLRRWVAQDDVDHARRDGVTSDEREQLRSLKAENKRLKQDNEILRKASIFFAGELDPRNR